MSRFRCLVPIACVFTLTLAPPVRAQSLWPATGRLAMVPPLSVKQPTAAPLVAMPAMAQPLTPGQLCRRAIRAAEQAAAIPNQLMAAIARIESGRREADGTVNPWPWSINAEGVDQVFDTKAEAVAAVRALQQKGMRSVDVGCMQVNLLYHKDAFTSLEDAFDPAINAAYAARFLVQLHEQTGTWPTATAWYHSATPELGADYQRKVMAVLPDEQRRAPAAAVSAGGIAPASSARGGVAPTATHTFTPHNIPQAVGTIGRSLAAYRAAPIPLAARPFVRTQPGVAPG